MFSDIQTKIATAFSSQLLQEKPRVSIHGRDSACVSLALTCVAAWLTNPLKETLTQEFSRLAIVYSSISIKTFSYQITLMLLLIACTKFSDFSNLSHYC